MNYRKLNIYLGWAVFLIATIVYLVTIEDTVSLWDCGEYITAAYKLEVGHPPGAPLFMVLGRLFSFFADPSEVAVWINRLSALSSSLTILFMFWSITLLVKKIVLKTKSELSSGDKIAIFGAAFIGSLAYTFSDSFWFSAVEGEVYAMASLFTAAIFWAILKWDEEMAEIQNGNLVAGYSPDRWLLLILFLLGLAIGVHLLGILVVPAIAFVIYFRYSTQVNLKGILLVGVLSIVVLGFIQEGIIPGTVSLASSFEVAFVNSLGLSFFSGSAFFFLLVIGCCVLGLRYARKKDMRILYSSIMGLIVLLIGYGSFAVIVIRSNANTPLDENNPENLVTLHSYLKREQYGSAPVFYGPYWNSKQNPSEDFKNLSPFYLRRHVVSQGGQDIKAYLSEDRANEFAKTLAGAEVDEKYFMSNSTIRENAVATYAQNTIFPRMYWSQEKRHIDGYKAWSGYDPNDGSNTELGSDGKRLPTMGENLRYFAKYQVNWMYWRYFMWNFAGRQNDIQGHGDKMRGNWLSGFSFVDNMRLGNQNEGPYYTTENKSFNKFWFLPLILGLVGLFFHFYRAPKDAFVVFLVFLFTGLAIVVYLNQKPLEPRERDYAYAGSFYFFAMWIGIGVYALYEAFKSFGKKEFSRIGVIALAGLLLTFADSTASAASWLLISGIAALMIGLMVLLRRVLTKDSQGATIAVLLTLIVPVIMGVQGWDDHDRSLKSSARDLALNYLNSCSKNGIIFTNGDNDTFPLWYAQEVEGERTDVRVCNLSLMQTDWYTDQMKMKAYDSDPLPIKFTEEQILMYAGSTDQVVFAGLFDLFYYKAKPEIIKKVIKLRAKVKPRELANAVDIFNASAVNILNTTSATDPRTNQRLNQIRAVFSQSSSDDITNDIYQKFQAGIEIFKAVQSGVLTAPESSLKQLQEILFGFEESWNFTNLIEAMEFVRDDQNLVRFDGGRMARVFPSTGFVLPVNKENAVKSGIITPKQKDDCLNEISFVFKDRYLTREEVMMLDVIANNNWKRGIYFSSPNGSNVATALYRGIDPRRGGYIKQNGMAFELSPLNNNDGLINKNKMYKHLMETYIYGAMDNPKVLTDYYTRRHTSQFRSHFYRLAEDYLRSALFAEEEHKNNDLNMSMGQNQVKREPSLTKEQIKEFKKKAIALLNRSLEVMPAETVIDYGEPVNNYNPRENYEFNGLSLSQKNDGILQDYIDLYLLAGEKKEAEKLANIVASQLESIIGYYEKSNPGVVLKGDNTDDLFAALHSYMSIWSSLNNEDSGIPKSEVAKRTDNKVQYYFSKMIPSMKDKLKQLANENGESTRRGGSAGQYANMLFNFEDYTTGIAVYFQIMAAPGQNQDNNLPAGMSLEDLMMQMPVQDSVGR